MKQSSISLDGHIFETAYFDEQTLEWVIVFSTDIKLRIDYPWRVVLADDIVLGWQGNKQGSYIMEARETAEQLKKLLSNQQVEASELSPQGDLSIDFKNSAEFSIFIVSNSYECWELSDPSGRIVIAQGGGQILEFPAI